MIFNQLTRLIVREGFINLWEHIRWKNVMRIFKEAVADMTHRCFWGAHTNFFPVACRKFSHPCVVTKVSAWQICLCTLLILLKTNFRWTVTSLGLLFFVGQFSRTRSFGAVVWILIANWTMHLQQVCVACCAAKVKNTAKSTLDFPDWFLFV